MGGRPNSREKYPNNIKYFEIVTRILQNHFWCIIINLTITFEKRKKFYIFLQKYKKFMFLLLKLLKNVLEPCYDTDICGDINN